MRNHAWFYVGMMLLLAGCWYSDGEIPAGDAGTHAGHETGSVTSDAPLATTSIYQVTSEWKTQEGTSIRLSALRGRPQVVAMAYTHCEYACPRIVADMKAIYRATSAHHDTEIGLVLISLDPTRDTSERLASYAQQHNLARKDWTLLQGSEDAILEMAALLGVRYQKQADGEFAHSNLLTILDAEGTLVYQQDGLGEGPRAGTIEIISMLQHSDETHP